MNMTREELHVKAIEFLALIEERREAKRHELLNKGYIGENDRVTYEFVYMDDLENDLIDTLATFHRHFSYYNRVRYSKDFLKVSLAAVCQLIKSPDYVKSIRKTYFNRTGLDFNNTMYYSILEQAFINEGILPSNWDELKGASFRFKDVLVQESGVPAWLVGKIIKLFLLYWKYLRGTPFTLWFLNTEEWKKHSNIRFEPNEFKEFQELHNTLNDYPQKVSKVFEQLTRICELLVAEDYEIEQLEDENVVEGLNEAAGFNIYNILPRKESLKSLYFEVLNKVTPTKLCRILNKKPRNIIIGIPSGAKVVNKHYKDIQLGEHSIFDIKYTVVPDLQLSVEDLIEWRENEIISLGDKIGFRNKSKYDVSVGQYRKYKPWPLYHNEFFYGYFWVGVIAEGLPISIANKKIPPAQPIYAKTNFKYFWNSNLCTYDFMLQLTDLRIYLPEYKDRHISLECNFSSKRKDFMLTADGCREIDKFEFPLDKQWDGEHLRISLNLQDSSNTQQLSVFEHSIQEMYCYNRVTKSPLSPGNYQFGSDRFLIFVAPSLSEKLLFDENVASVKNYTTNFFYIYGIYWRNKNVPLEFSIGQNQWSFKQPIIFYLKNLDTEIDEKDDAEQADSLNCLQYEVCTNLTSEELLEKIFIIVVYGDGIHKELRISQIAEISDNKIHLKGERLQQKLQIETDYIGNISLSFIYNQTAIYEKNIQIFPRIKLINEQLLFQEDELIKLKINASHNCLYDSGSIVNQIELAVGRAKLVLQDGFVKSEDIPVEVFIPPLNSYFHIKFSPKVFGYRFLRSDGTISKTRLVNFSDLYEDKLLIIGKAFENVELKANSSIISLRLNEFGEVTYELKNLIQVIVDPRSSVLLSSKHLVMSFTINWDIQVYSFRQVTNNVSEDISFELDYEGPPTSTLWFELTEPNGSLIKFCEVNCRGSRQCHIIKISIPEGHEGDLLLTGYYSKDDEGGFGQHIYTVSKEILQNDYYTFNMLVTDIDKIAIIAKKFMSQQLLIGGDEEC